jgi:hypothetical protein
MQFIESVAAGIGATLCIDVWAVLLRKVFDVRSLDYCLLGRWVLHMPERIRHDSIATSAVKAHECKIGWIAHYSIGVAFAVLFVGVMPDDWLLRPTPLPAVVFGVITVVVPWFTMQPAFGMGMAASRTPTPAAARLKSLTTHAIFGAGLYLSAQALTILRERI